MFWWWRTNACPHDLPIICASNADLSTHAHKTEFVIHMRHFKSETLCARAKHIHMTAAWVMYYTTRARDKHYITSTSILHICTRSWRAHKSMAHSHSLSSGRASLCPIRKCIERRVCSLIVYAYYILILILCGTIYVSRLNLARHYYYHTSRALGEWSDGFEGNGN